MIEFPKHLEFDYYLNMYVSSKNNKNNNFYIQTIIIFFIYRREDKDEKNIKVVADNNNILFKLIYNEEHPFDEILIIGTVIKQTKQKQSTKFSTVWPINKHMYFLNYLN